MVHCYGSYGLGEGYIRTRAHKNISPAPHRSLVMLTLLITSALVATAAAATLPLANCKVKDPEFDSCLKNTINNLIPKLTVEGIPDMDLKALEPLSIPTTSLRLDSDMASGDLEVKNTKVHGLKDSKVQHLRSHVEDPKHVVLELKTFHPKLIVEGSYKGIVDISLFNIDGDGDFKVIAKKVKAVVKAEGHVDKVGGENFLKLDKISIIPEIGGLNINATNLIKDDPDLSELVLNLANDMWPVFYKQLLPSIRPQIESIAINVINGYAKKIPLSKIVIIE